ncbi:MAG: sulfatase-like hydrolase/transferase, partial [bacterium]|nr:sulfatase-like hydrolase/transferase [bacterium]
DQYCLFGWHEGPRYHEPLIWQDGAKRSGTEGQYGPDIYVDFLIDFMQRHRNQPQMLYFPMALTHGPFTTTPHDRDATGKLDQHKAMVRYTDYTVGRLVDALEELGLRERTIVIFTTDNGSTRGVTGRLNGRDVPGGKAMLSENGVCEPFIVNGPGLVPEGVVSDALTDFSDMLPTFCGLAGVPVPGDIVVDGHSIADVILGRKPDSDREWIMALGAHPARLTEEGVFPALPYAPRAIRDKRYKLWVEEGRGTKLYDLQTDPGEETNLIQSTDPAPAGARRRLQGVIDSQPQKDARPHYDPTPPQPWDRKPPWPKPKGK